MHFRANTKKGWKRLGKQYKCSQQGPDLLLENVHVNKQVNLTWVFCAVATGISTVILQQLAFSKWRSSKKKKKREKRNVILTLCGDMIQQQLPVLTAAHRYKKRYGSVPVHPSFSNRKPSYAFCYSGHTCDLCQLGSINIVLLFWARTTP